ncbi:MAG: hypothetical protein VX130_03660 [Verrucomicrobiota bacterium]|nr:hypothetical protein [Verrucomicrobiota bacterium]
MNVPEENPTDEELANLVNEDATDSSLSESGEDGTVEMGVPPALEDEEELDSNEESFSISDFESNLSSQDDSGSKDKEDSVDQNVDDTVADSETIPSEMDAVPPADEVSPPVESHSTNGSGGVAEFRKTLANLSRQLEIDRLAFLHKALKERGEKLPSLSQIADDIHGSHPLFPEGDCDLYGKRPAARLEGWISGLSFGSNRRAKKFSK